MISLEQVDKGFSPFDGTMKVSHARGSPLVFDIFFGRLPSFKISFAAAPSLLPGVNVSAA